MFSRETSIDHDSFRSLVERRPARSHHASIYQDKSSPFLPGYLLGDSHSHHHPVANSWLWSSETNYSQGQRGLSDSRAMSRTLSVQDLMRREWAGVRPPVKGLHSSFTAYDTSDTWNPGNSRTSSLPALRKIASSTSAPPTAGLLHTLGTSQESLDLHVMNQAQTLQVSQVQYDPVSSWRDSNSENVLDETWVTVFGFPPVATSFVLQQFSQYGTIIKHTIIPECNWMHIHYSSKIQARKALSNDGKVYSECLKLGVVPCTERSVFEGTKSQSLDKMATYSSGLSLGSNRNIRPLTAAYKSARMDFEVGQFKLEVLNLGDMVSKKQVVVSDKNWRHDKSSTATVFVTVTSVSGTNGSLGFIQPVYFQQIKENSPLGPNILFLDVENQGDRMVTCSFIPGSKAEEKFSLRNDDTKKNCYLYLIGSLDREMKDTYDFNVSVVFANTGRKKRQANTEFKYNTWPIARIRMEVVDVNDNSPMWVLVPYPRSDILPDTGTRGIFITAVDALASPETDVAALKATDADIGLNGEIFYIIENLQNNDPFGIDLNDGTLYTVREFFEPDKSTKMSPYQLTVTATDKSQETTGNRKNTTFCYVNLIRPKNRFVLVVNNVLMKDALLLKEAYRAGLQDAIGYVVLIESIDAKRVQTSTEGIVQIEETSSDITFVVAQPFSPYQLISNTDDFANKSILSQNGFIRIRDRIFGANVTITDDMIHRPIENLNAGVIGYLKTKSYIWWMDDPYAALIALAAIIILLCIVGIIVIIFTYSRYMKFLHQYRVHMHSFDNPDFIEPPNFLREYETQSLNISVPPDEAIADMGELKMTFNETGVENVQHTKHDPRVAAVVNPMYHGEKEQHLAHSAHGRSDGTTNL